MSVWRGPGLFVKDTEAERRNLEGKVRAAEEERDKAIAEMDTAIRAKRDADNKERTANVSATDLLIC